jgi:hypothetical protein
MKVTYGPIVSDARKKIGGIVATKVHAGNMFRKKVAPVQPHSPRQLAVRGGLTNFAKAWSAQLSEAQRAAWSALAATVTRSDKLGNKYKLPGLALFVMLNQNLLLLGVPEILDAPADLSVDQYTALSITSAVAETLPTTGIVNSGGINTVSYSLGSKVAPIAGDHAIISGYADAGNNGDFVVITPGSGTFTVAAPNGVTSATTGKADVFSLVVAFTPTPLTGNVGSAISATKPVSAGRSTSFGSPAFIQGYEDPDSSPHNIAAPYAAKYGHPGAGKKVQVQAWPINQTTGAAGRKWSAIAQF